MDDSSSDDEIVIALPDKICGIDFDYSFLSFFYRNKLTFHTTSFLIMPFSLSLRFHMGYSLVLTAPNTIDFNFMAIYWNDFTDLQCFIF